MDDIIAPSTKNNLIFFHGFLGHPSDWKTLFDGLKDSYSDLHTYPLSSFQEQFEEIISYKNACYVGYSMGGRAATVAALANAHCRGLFLESSSLGIEDESEREQRAREDLLLKEKIQKFTSEEFSHFLSQWYDLPLFRGIKNSPYYPSMIEKKRESFSREEITKELELFGLGTISPLTSSLQKATFPISYISGEWDEKYTNYGRKLCEIFPKINIQVVKEASHNIHLTHPSNYTELLLKFLQTLPTAFHAV